MSIQLRSTFSKSAIACFLTFILIIAASSARSEVNFCDVRVIENLPEHSYYKKGELFSVTVYDPGDGRTTDAFSGHGGGFIPAHVFKDGHWIPSLQLTSYCKIGRKYADGANWLAVEEVRSRIPPLKLKLTDTSRKLSVILLCSNCADSPSKFYTYKKNSICAQDVTRVLRGDTAAVERVKGRECTYETFQQAFPEWADPEGPPPFDPIYATAPGREQQIGSTDSQSAVSFMKSVYEPYFHDHLSFLGDGRSDPRLVNDTLEPSLAALWHRYSSNPKRQESPGPIDGDPICSCQEADISNLHFTVTDAGQGTVKAIATFKIGRDTRIVTFLLIVLDQHWHISDISDNISPLSLRQILERDGKNSG